MAHGWSRTFSSPSTRHRLKWRTVALSVGLMINLLVSSSAKRGLWIKRAWKARFIHSPCSAEDDRVINFWLFLPSRYYAPGVRVFFIVGIFLYMLWGALYWCTWDLLLWGAVFFVQNFAQLVYILYSMRRVGFAKDLEILYAKVNSNFLVLKTSQGNGNKNIQHFISSR